MNYRTRRFGKIKRSCKFSLLLISVILVFSLSGLPAGGEENLGMLAFNTCSQGSLVGHGLQGWGFSAASGFKLKEGYPKPRVFTPNGDTRNDEVIFKYENIEERSIVCWIYDIKGSVVRQLDIESWEDEFSWDGTNENNNVAPSGIYIYQIEIAVEGQTINGTIVLAK